jgi:ADP-ribose pyrophosphatase YjhB (NUDIX family)
MTLEELALGFAAEIEREKPTLEMEVQWPGGRLRRRVFIGDREWPQALATSARGVVFRGSRVVVVRQKDGRRHIQPGGRLEGAETVDAALRRELLEETGWAVGELKPLGFQHFQPIGERPVDVQAPWRDFVWPIFVVEALAFDRGARDASQLEAGARLTSIRRALAEIPADEATVLKAAVDRRRRP